MKKLLLTLSLTLSLICGFTNTYSAVTVDPTAIENIENRIYIKVYEDGAIWIYVYEEDGTFVEKYIENNF